MFIINDIELLERLSKHKILNHLAQFCTLTVSNIKLNDYSLRVRQIIETVNDIIVLETEKQGFDAWMEGKRKYLSIGDLSSIYLAISNRSAILVLSPEDEPLKDEVQKHKVAQVQFDDFCIKMIRDEKMIQLYHLIKVA